MQMKKVMTSLIVHKKIKYLDQQYLLEFKSRFSWNITETKTKTPEMVPEMAPEMYIIICIIQKRKYL